MLEDVRSHFPVPVSMSATCVPPYHEGLLSSVTISQNKLFHRSLLSVVFDHRNRRDTKSYLCGFLFTGRALSNSDKPRTSSSQVERMLKSMWTHGYRKVSSFSMVWRSFRFSAWVLSAASMKGNCYISVNLQVDWYIHIYIDILW